MAVKREIIKRYTVKHEGRICNKTFPTAIKAAQYKEKLDKGLVIPEYADGINNKCYQEL